MIDMAYYKTKAQKKRAMQAIVDKAKGLFMDGDLTLNEYTKCRDSMRAAFKRIK